MHFSPYIIDTAKREKVRVVIEVADEKDLRSTCEYPEWQTDWTSVFLADSSISKYAIKTLKGELVALAAYQIKDNKAYVYILYTEAAPHSNPTMKAKNQRKYSEIRRLAIAFGIKFSIDNSCRGDIVFEAKTEELAKHYEADFHAVRIPNPNSNGIPRYMLVDEAAWDLFSYYLASEEEE